MSLPDLEDSGIPSPFSIPEQRYPVQQQKPTDCLNMQKLFLCCCVYKSMFDHVLIKKGECGVLCSGRTCFVT